jgi:hypothetical protein
MRIRCAHLALKGAAWLQLVLHVVVGCGWGGAGRGGAGRGGVGWVYVVCAFKVCLPHG